MKAKNSHINNNIVIIIILNKDACHKRSIFLKKCLASAKIRDCEPPVFRKINGVDW